MSGSNSGTSFVKAHGLGNDFVILKSADLTAPLTADGVRALLNRHTGVGADQLLELTSLERSSSHAKVRFWNADGTTSEMCGNGLRAIGLYLKTRENFPDKINVATEAGPRAVEVLSSDRVRVGMGEPTVSKADEWFQLGVEEFAFRRVSVGNPHAVFVTDDVARVPLEAWGPRVETDARFPNRTNAEWVQVLSRTHARVRVWERGAGPTLACGSGAVAVMAALVTLGLVERVAEIELPGGSVRVTWAEGGELTLEGPAAIVFEGRLPSF